MEAEKAFQKRIEAMTDEARDHFKDVIEMLSHCYEKDSEVQAVVIVSREGFPIVKIRTVNIDEMESAAKLQMALDCLTALNMNDAPPREQFN